MTIADIIDLFSRMFIWAMVGVFCFIGIVVIWGIRKNR